MALFRVEAGEVIRLRRTFPIIEHDQREPCFCFVRKLRMKNLSVLRHVLGPSRWSPAQERMSNAETGAIPAC